MTRFLGIDHPLIAVWDIEAIRKRYAALGFRMTPVSQHPWGTSTSAAVFHDCLLELMGIYDESLIDRLPAGDFRFGRIVRDHLTEREGISLLALNSTDADGDVRIVEERGVASQGGIEFGRDITLPDGRPDRTSTSLRIIYDPELPRLSNFICQQHRRDLIEVPKWLEHPNGATGICQITVMASVLNQPRVRDRMTKLYGEQAVTTSGHGFSTRTGNGSFVVSTREGIQAAYGEPLPASLATEEQPCCVAVHIRIPDLATAMPFLNTEEVRHLEGGKRLVLTPPEAFGNLFLVFDADPIS